MKRTASLERALRLAAVLAAAAPAAFAADPSAPAPPPPPAAPSAEPPGSNQAPAGQAGGEAGAQAGSADEVAPERRANDPLEGLNRKIFSFNEGLDRAILKPVAEGYRDAVPHLVRQGVSNFFGNFSDAWSAVNQLLQGKLQYGLEMSMRVAVNTVFGLGGLTDPASEAGLEKRSEDFGQTLGRWGIGPGPYLVLPVLGPSDLRDTVALPADRLGSPAFYVDDTGAVIGLTVLQIIDARAALLGATGLVDSIALDKYSFVRDGYVARRRSLVYDGDPPDEPAAPAAPASTGAR